MARGKNGITRNQSVKRIRITSTQPPRVAGRYPDERPDQHGDTGGEESDEKRDLGALYDQIQHRPSELVGAEPEPRRRWLERRAWRVGHREAGLGGEHVGEHGHEDEHDQDRQPRNPHLVADEEPRRRPERLNPARPAHGAATRTASGVAWALTRDRSWGRAARAAGLRRGWRRSPRPRTSRTGPATADNPDPR